VSKIATSLFGDCAFMPFQAEVPIAERFEFVTDVIESDDGTEERLKLRTLPRQYFEYSIPLQDFKKSDAFNTLYGGLRDNWIIPLWSEGQSVGTISAGQTVINCNTLVYDLQTASLALIYSNCNIWQIVEIQSKTDSTITLASGAEAQTSAILIPIKKAIVIGNTDISTNGQSGFVKLLFQIDKATDITSGTQESYKGYDIYYEESLLGSANFIQKTMQKRQILNDFDLGNVAQSTPWQNSKYGTPYRVLLEDYDEVREFKRWIFRLAGKHRAFWIPTFENDLRKKSSGVVSSTLLVESDSILDYATSKTNIAVRDINGVWYPREITLFEQVSEDTVRITLDAPLGIYAQDIIQISYLGLNRLDVDKIQLNWIGNSKVQSEIRMLEIEPSVIEDVTGSISLLETGFYSLLESGDRSLLEN
jgi:hypothetical protein